MNKPKRFVYTIACALALALSGPWSGAFGRSIDGPYWTGTWAASPIGLPSLSKLASYSFPGATPRAITIEGTIRYRIRVALGGARLRLRFSNEYGDGPLDLAAVTVGIASDGLNAVPGSLVPVTFEGKRSITIPGGAPALSDPVALRVNSLGDLVVSVDVPNGIVAFACTDHFTSSDQAVVEDSDATSIEKLSPGKCLWTMRPLVSEVDVLKDHPHKVIVTLGDSITNGSVDPTTGDRGWPGALARRLVTQGVSVVNAGISGNRLLRCAPMFGSSALARFDRDVLSVPGLSDIVMLEGINDIGMSGPKGMFGSTQLVTADQLIAAYMQIVARAHEHGVKVIGATILPFDGAFYYSAEKEAVREAVNDWIRTSKIFDGVVDFDMAVRDPGHPGQLKGEFDSGDHLHPNPAGYRRMGEVIDLHLFK